MHAPPYVFCHYHRTAPAPVCCETRSATLPGHDPTTSKPPAQRREPPSLLSWPTPLHVTPPTARTCYESQVWAVANPGPSWNPKFGTPLQPLQNPSFGTLLSFCETLTLGRYCNPCKTLALARCCHLCENLTLERYYNPCETLALGCWCRICETLALGRYYSHNFHVSSINSANRIYSV